MDCGEHPAAPEPAVAGRDPPAEEVADLVAGQHAPAVSGGDADGAPVRVGIVRDHEIAVGIAGRREREVHRAGLLGVGEGHGREVRIRFELLGDDDGRGEAGLLEDAQEDLAADAMHGRVRQPDVQGRTLLHECGCLLDVRLDDVVAEGEPLVAVREVRHRSEGRHLAMCALISRSTGETIWLPSPRYTLYPLSAGGLWLAVTITPAAQPRCRTANASTGVGR